MTTSTGARRAAPRKRTDRPQQPRGTTGRRAATKTPTSGDRRRRATAAAVIVAVLAAAGAGAYTLTSGPNGPEVVTGVPADQANPNDLSYNPPPTTPDPATIDLYRGATTDAADLLDKAATLADTSGPVTGYTPQDAADDAAAILDISSRIDGTRLTDPAADLDALAATTAALNGLGTHLALLGACGDTPAPPGCTTADLTRIRSELATATAAAKAALAALVG